MTDKEPRAAPGRLAGPLLFLAAAAVLLWSARGSAFVSEDLLKIPDYCGTRRAAPLTTALLTREIGEDGDYYRPSANILLGAEAKLFGCSDPRPYRLVGGLVWTACAAMLAFFLLSLGVSPGFSWAGAGLLLVHPHSSWYFVSALMMSGGPLTLFGAIGAWLCYAAAEKGRRPLAAALGAAAFVYLGCLAKETAVLIPAGLAVAAYGFGRPRSRETARVLVAAAAAAGLYLLQRHWVLAHDPAVVKLDLHWDRLPDLGAALSIYARVLATGSFRVDGEMIPRSGTAIHLAAWIAAFAAAAWAAKLRREFFAACVLLVFCAAEFPLSLMLNGETMPTRATNLLAGLVAILMWGLSRRATPRTAPALLAAVLAVSGLCLGRSVRHALASRDGDAFLELHSNPPYSWKIEGQRVASRFAKGDAAGALAAARAGESLRPSWLTSALAAAVESSFDPRALDRVRALAAAADGQPAAHIGLVNLGVALGRGGAWDEAVACFERAARLAPTYAPAWAQRSWAEAGRGRWAESAGAARRALALNPENADARQNLAYASLRLRDWRAAAENYAALLATDPKRAPSRVFWALAEERLGSAPSAWDALSGADDAYAAAYRARLAPRLGRTAPPADPASAAGLRRLIVEISGAD